MTENDLLNEIRKTLTLEGEAILGATRALNNVQSNEGKNWIGSLRSMEKAIEQGGKIICTGVGKSGKIAQKVSATFASTGTPSIYLHPTEGLHGDLGYVRAHDVVLAFSYTGNTEELLRILPALRNLKTLLIAITGNTRSQLAEHAQWVIDAHVQQEACPHNLAPTTSTTLALAIGDALAVGLMKLRNFDAESFARNHPGGSLGRRLHLSVGDCMQKGSAVGTVSPQALMDAVVIEATQKRLGAVLVVEGPQLLGIITDGDIRKALSHREGFFTKPASEIMTRRPVTAVPEMPAREALALMENRESPISVLPVVDSQGNWKGLLRLHDLLQTF